jgi:hypothetical protein
MKSISYAHVMHHIRIIAPKAIQFQQDHKDPVISIGEDQLSREVFFIELIITSRIGKSSKNTKAI